MAEPYFQNQRLYPVVVPAGTGGDVTIPPGKYAQGTYYTTVVTGLTQTATVPAPEDLIYVYVNTESPIFTSGSGVPVNGSNPDGSYYFSKDAGHIYFASGGTWSVLV